MDRFIVLIRKSNKVDYKYLKSNMDRFIAAIDSGLSTLVPDLKSNMDRFIVGVDSYDISDILFKIQYG